MQDQNSENQTPAPVPTPPVPSALETFLRTRESLRSGFPVPYRISVISLHLLLAASSFLLGLYSDFLLSIKGVLMVVALVLVGVAIVALLNLLIRHFIESVKKSQPLKGIGVSIIVLVVLLSLSVGGIALVVMYQTMTKGINASRESKNAIQPEFQKLWDEDRGDANKLLEHVYPPHLSPEDMDM